MARFTNAEYADVHFVYGFCDGNARAASTEYQCRYPDQTQPNRHVFVTVHCSLRKTGAFMPPTHVRHGRRNIQNKDEMLNAVHANPSTSTGRVAYETPLSESRLA
jgi:hypothetical protein